MKSATKVNLKIENSPRQVILHVDTTGFKIGSSKFKEQRDRILNIEAIELIDGQRTGKELRKKINPEHSISLSATSVNHLKQKDVKDEPVFADIKDELLKFIADAEVITIRSWVKSFINSELHRFDKDDNINNHCKDVIYVCNLHKNLCNLKKLPKPLPLGLEGLCKEYAIDTTKSVPKVDRLAELFLKITTEKLKIENLAKTVQENADADLKHAVADLKHTVAKQAPKATSSDIKPTPQPKIVTKRKKPDVTINTSVTRIATRASTLGMFAAKTTTSVVSDTKVITHSRKKQKIA